MPVRPPLTDGDWNVRATPLAGFDDLLTNAEGWQNYDPLLELEIDNDFPLSTYFHEGEYIWAFGWHVEDWGHSAVSPIDDTHPAVLTIGGKTEFHPIIYLASLRFDVPDFKLFAAQDASGRFVASENSLDSYFDGWSIPVGQHQLVRVQQLGSQVALEPVEFVSESALVDIGVAEMGVSQQANQACWAKYRSVISADQSDGEVRITPRLGPYGGCLKQVYFGAFHRSLEPILRDSAVWSLTTLPDGHVALDGQVHDSLLTPSNHPGLVFTSWKFHETTQANITVVSPTYDNLPGNAVAYGIRYAPSLGLTQHTWWLWVDGSTRPPGWTPGANRQANGLGPFDGRDFAGAIIRHNVIPSSLALTVTPNEWPVNTAAPPATVASCVTSYTVSPKISLVVPSLQATPVSWQVIQTRSSAGEDISNPNPVVVPTDGSPVTLDGVTAAVSGNNELHVAFANARPGGHPIASPTVMTQYFTSFSAVTAVAHYSTALGEAPEAAAHLALSPCFTRYPSLASAWMDFQKLIWIMETLHAQGFGPSLSPTLPPSVVQAWSGVTVPLGLPESWYGHLSPAGQRLASTYTAMAAGQPVPQTAAAEVLHGLELAARLPNRPSLAAPSLIDTGTMRRMGLRDTTYLPSGPTLLKPAATRVVPQLGFDVSGTLTRGSIRLLLDWSRLLKNAPSRRVRLTYTAPQGLAIAEAQHRAGLIQQFLLHAGVSPLQVSVTGVVGSGAPKIELLVR